MRGYKAFAKKELTEYTRSYKLMILMIVFLLLGFMSPPTAKFMPDIIAKFMPEGMAVTLPEVSILDSWTQFYKNVPQIGMIVFAIVFSGLMAGELGRGTLVNVLTKGLSRRTVILSKFTAAGLMWSLCYLSSFLATFFYNYLFWQDTQVSHPFFAAACVWVFGFFIISGLILGGTLFHNNFGSLLLVGAALIGLFIVNLFPPAAEYNPLKLLTGNMQILTGEAGISDFYAAMGITVGAAVILLMVSVFVFDRKRI